MPTDNVKLKNVFITVFLGFLMLVIIYSLFFGPAKKFSDSLMPVRTITVSAEGKKIAEPDIAKLSFSAISEGADPEKIVEDNNKKINSAIDFIKSEGIDSKDIKTTQYNLSPRYEYDEKTKKTFISGYTLTQSVLVKIRDFKKIGKILSGLPVLGINQIGSISFEVDDPDKYLAEARDKAFDKAKEKAKEMAEKNGVKLGRVIDFYEYQGQPPVGPVFRMSEAAGAAALPTPPVIEPGTQEIKVQVSITYEIR